MAIVVAALRHPQLDNLWLHGQRQDTMSWTVPAGHLLPGESPEDGARRELLEEVGVTNNSLRLVKEGKIDGDEPIYLFVGIADPQMPMDRFWNDPDEEFIDLKFLDPKHPGNWYVPEDRNILLQWLNEQRLTGNPKVAVHDLEKGVMRRIAPFNPKQVDPLHQERVGRWTNAGYDVPHEDEDRQMIPRLEGNARARALHKLTGMTQSRRNPQTGEREFLLHRGMREEEHGKHVKGTAATYPKVTTWSASQDVAHQFGSEANWPTREGEHKPNLHLVSAWVPESKVHHLPMMLGRLGGELEDHGPGKFQRREEHEVLTSPGQFAVHSVSPIEPGPGHEDDYQPRPFKKGVAQRKFPFKPQELRPADRREVEGWVSGDLASAPSRDNLPGMSESAFNRAVMRLGKRTKFRRNPKSGDVEALLHRGVGPLELTETRHSPLHARQRTSWTPNYNKARNFAHQYVGNEKYEGKYTNVSDAEKDAHVLSAWVPVHKIAHIPNQYGLMTHSHSSGQDKEVAQMHPSQHRNEHEVVTEPHQFEMASKEDLQPKDASELIHARQENVLLDKPLHVTRSTYPDYFRRKLKKNLEKGVMRRLYPYNPQEMDERQEENVAAWQDEGAGQIDDEMSQRDWRDAIDPEPYTSPARERFLHKLSAATKVRRSVDGKREFLLHRGMSRDEHTRSHPDLYTVQHKERSSWTPIGPRAEDFARGYKGRTASAWIHENNIVTVPKQYGKLTPPMHPQLLDEEGVPRKPKGENVFSLEHEVIVDPHESRAAKPEDLVGVFQRAPHEMDISYRLSSFKLQRRNKAIMDASKEARQKGLTGEAHQAHVINATKMKKGELRKAPLPYDAGDNVAMVQQRDKDYKRIKVAKLPNGLEHHVWQDQTDKNAYTHEIRHPAIRNRLPLAQMNVYHDVPDEEYNHDPDNAAANTPPTVKYSLVNPLFRGQRFGKQLYLAALAHHGHLQSDNLVSPAAHKVWEQLQRTPGVYVDLGEYSNEPWAESERHSAMAGTFRPTKRTFPQPKLVGVPKRASPKKAPRMKKEELAKAPLVTDQEYADRWASKPVIAQNEDKYVKTLTLPGGMFHHVFDVVESPGYFGATHRHIISGSKNPRDRGVAHMLTGPGYGKKALVPPQIYGVAVDPDHKGKNFGKLIYQEAARYHGGLTSGPQVSERSMRVWRNMTKDPALSTKLAPMDTRDKFHQVKIRVKKEELSKTPISEDTASLANYLTNATDMHHRHLLSQQVSKEMTPSERLSMLDSMASRVPNKKIGGVRHFLLHRGMSRNEALDPNPVPVAYSTDEYTAANFARAYKGVTRSHWVPETHVVLSHHQDDLADVKGGHKIQHSGEGEVLVRPGNFVPARRRMRKTFPSTRKSEQLSDLEKAKIFDLKSRRMVADTGSPTPSRSEPPKPPEPDPKAPTLRSSRFSTPEGNVWVTHARHHGGQESWGFGSEREASRNAAVNKLPEPGKTGAHPAAPQVGTAPGQVSGSAQHVVGVHHFLRQKMPFYMTQTYDHHVMLHPEDGGVSASIIAMHRKDPSAAAQYVHASGSTGEEAIHNALNQMMLHHARTTEPTQEHWETGEAAAPKVPASPAGEKRNSWLTHSIYRTPKVALKDAFMVGVPKVKS